MFITKSLINNLCHPIKYMHDRNAKQTAQLDADVKKGVTTLTTSEKGILGRSADAIRVFFRMKGTPGSVANLKYSLNQLKKHIITRKKDGPALSPTTTSIKAFAKALNSRATLLKLPVSDKMITAYATQLCKNKLGKAFNGKAMDPLIKTILAVDKKGYSKTVKAAMGIAAVTFVAAALYGVSQYYNLPKKAISNALTLYHEPVQQKPDIRQTVTCKDILDKGFSGQFTCYTKKGTTTTPVTVPPLSKSKYFLTSKKTLPDGTLSCVAAAFEATKNLIDPNNRACEAWEITSDINKNLKVKMTLWDFNLAYYLNDIWSRRAPPSTSTQVTHFFAQKPLHQFYVQGGKSSNGLFCQQKSSNWFFCQQTRPPAYKSGR